MGRPPGRPDRTLVRRPERPKSTVVLRPTKLGLTPLVGAGALGGLAIVTGDSWMLLMAAAAVGVTVAARLLRPRLDAVVVEVTTTPQAELGAEVTSRVHAINRGNRTVPPTRLRHHVDGLRDVTVLVGSLPPLGCAQATVRRPTVARGVFGTGTVTLTSSAPLGLLWMQRTLPAATDLVVHPRVVRVQAPIPTAAAGGTGQPQRSRSGLDVHGIREWQRGDGARQVHWRSTARRGRLVVLEREETHGSRLALCMAGPQGGPAWESLLSAVASLAVAAARTGRTVTLMAPDPVLPRLGTVTSTDESELLRWCAALGAVGPLDPAALRCLAQLLGPGAEVMVAVSAGALPPGWWDWAGPAGASAGLRLFPAPPPPAPVHPR